MSVNQYIKVSPQEAFVKSNEIKLVEETILPINDVEHLIIKIHILVEYALNICIEKLSFKNTTRNYTFTFYEKVFICDGLGIFNGNNGNETMSTIFELNDIRNDIAHKIKFKRNRLPNLYKNYPKIYARFKPLQDDEDHLQLLKVICVSMFAYLIGRLDAKMEVNNIIATFPIDHKIQEMRDRLNKEISDLTNDNEVPTDEIFPPL